MNTEDLLYKKRHSLAHIMAEAVSSLYKDVKFGIGPPIKDGFYYDFSLSHTLTEEDFPLIEEKMREIIKTKSTFEKTIITKEKAKKIFSDQPFKIDLIEKLPNDAIISIYKSHNFVDLCKGPHVENMGIIDPTSFKLKSVAGAYWRGNEHNPMLQRIYAVAFSNRKEVKIYLNHLAEMEKRDHRKLGKALDLFSIQEKAGPGIIFWHPKGALIRNEIENYWKKLHQEHHYKLVYTPHVGNAQLWETSGHLQNYKENMFNAIEMDKHDYYVKPMNCPFHILIYKNTRHSYKELPIRYAELGTVYRYEKSGVLHGLMRVRGFTQDDAHIICTFDQAENEIRKVLDLVLIFLRRFHFEKFHFYLATRPEKAIGEEKEWSVASSALKSALEAKNLIYEMDEGGGAFYGPKIDVKIEDALGREWQLSTIQFDFNLSEKFQMTFINKDNKEEKPFIIHRAIMGSLERFFGILIEHYNGHFPFWLCPTQVKILSLGEKYNDYALEIKNKLDNKNYRVECDLSDENLNIKIKKAQQEKIPFLVLIGEKEQTNRKISLRLNQGKQKNLIDFIELETLIEKKMETNT